MTTDLLPTAEQKHLLDDLEVNLAFAHTHGYPRPVLTALLVAQIRDAAEALGDLRAPERGAK